MKFVQRIFNKMKPVIFLLGIAFLFSCNGNESKSDAFGNFEAEEVVVSSEANGVLTEFDLEEGAILKKDQQIGFVDTIIPALELQQLRAALQGVTARMTELRRGIEVQQQRLSVLKKEYDRVTSLYENKAIPEQKYDEVAGQYHISLRELEQLRSKKQVFEAELAMNKAQIDAATEKLSRCNIIAPASGTVLQKYAESGEFTGVGKPLFKMANTHELILRAYVAGSQLDDFGIGREVTVIYDKDAGDNHQVQGVVSWVASSAEFTPKIIQTKEERVDLVYAIKVRVANPEGKIKIGMPGEVLF